MGLEELKNMLTGGKKRQQYVETSNELARQEVLANAARGIKQERFNKVNNRVQSFEKGFSKQLNQRLQQLTRQSQTRLRRPATPKGVRNLINAVVPNSGRVNNGQLDYHQGRGRPKGAYAGKYAQFGGVYGYRAYVRAQKALARARQFQGSRVQQLPQLQQQQQYPQQQIQQRPGPPQYPYPNQQQVQQRPAYPQQYPPPQSQNNPQSQYYEDVDAFSGKTIIRKRLPTENWMR